ncbi:uncharacterized protein LOC126354851 [Schistocerca gregaria]|uniref:uncharacterized protein LOC126354851 n=1 Tax=Schistocerca gregaria TaxID=7010 RepID=UPI00211EB7C2|nr:uncharacterized protein LOC126354851 [Schistocerca gregaria]
MWRPVLAAAGTLVATALLFGVPASAASFTGDEDGAFTTGLGMAMRAYRQCEDSQDEVVRCLKLRAWRALERAASWPQIRLMDGVWLVHVGDEGDRAVGEGGAAGGASGHDVARGGGGGGGGDGPEGDVDELLLESAGHFLGSHSLQISVPQVLRAAVRAAANLTGDDGHLASGDIVEGDDQQTEEGRRRNGYNRKRYSSFMLMAMLMKGGLLAIAYKGVAILAAKALLVAKIALVISTLVALKKLVAGGGDEKVTYEIVKTPHVSHAFAHSGGYDHPGHYDRSTGGSGPYRRSVDLPYHAYQPIPLQHQDGAAAAA